MAQYTVELPSPDELFPLPSMRDLVPPHQRIHDALEALGVGPEEDRFCGQVSVELDWRQATFLAALLERAHRADTTAAPVQSRA
ncbi:hypothetical protein [Streptomyces sp. NPDC001404]|uniref:hypothetical protein n=1 Tax=Streptomyces sp. NPDC001404 TaxID=3364571 RepID=UPI00369F90BF